MFARSGSSTEGDPGRAVLLLSGGVGGARLAHGMAAVLPPEALTILVNTGDDFRHLGLHISPDVDTVLYTLAGLSDPKRGWGRADETWSFLETLKQLGGETWFQLGDRDLAVHLHRTTLLAEGRNLTEVTRSIAAALGIRHTILPMCNEPVRTFVETDEGPLPFQEYFVKRRCEPRIRGTRFEGIENARLNPFLDRKGPWTGVVIAPSNPYLSIGPILAMPGMRELLESVPGTVIAVSPIVGGRALKGPTAKIMQELGIAPSALEVARLYAGVIHELVIDLVDAELAPRIEALGITPVVFNTVMKSPRDRKQLAAAIVDRVSRMSQT